MENLFISLKLALLAKAKGFNEDCFAYYETNPVLLVINYNNLPLTEEQSQRPLMYQINNKNSKLPQWAVSAPVYCQIIDWFREKHNIDITIMPVFRDKCGYDSFKRDGYTFNIMRINPCQYLTWVDFNQCAEDRDEENKEYPDKSDRCLTPSFENYNECLNKAIESALKLI